MPYTLRIGAGSQPQKAYPLVSRTESALVPRPQPTNGITAALLPRLVEKHRPTLFIDEFDAMAQGDKETAEALRGQLNSSFNRRSAVVLKLVPGRGNGWEERTFSTWAPTCVAGIGTVSDTVEDRSVILRLARKLTAEPVRRLRGKDGGELALLARKTARWVHDNEIALRRAEPKAPEALNDRQADAWDPLLAIAEVAGGEWPRRAKEAAEALCGAAEAAAADSDIDVALLTDIKRIFHDLDADRLSGARLTAKLIEMEDRKWPTWNKGKPITQHQLARRLRPYGVISQPIRDGEEVFKGYWRAAFDDASARYLPSSGVSTRYNVTSSEKQGENAVSRLVTEKTRNELENAGNPSNSTVCNDVTTSKGGERGMRGKTPQTTPRPPCGTASYERRRSPRAGARRGRPHQPRRRLHPLPVESRRAGARARGVESRQARDRRTLAPLRARRLGSARRR
jgi:putative DNA primase/helicase